MYNQVSFISFTLLLLITELLSINSLACLTFPIYWDNPSFMLLWHLRVILQTHPCRLVVCFYILGRFQNGGILRHCGQFYFSYLATLYCHFLTLYSVFLWLLGSLLIMPLLRILVVFCHSLYIEMTLFFLVCCCCSGPLILDIFQATFSNSAIFWAGVIYPIAEWILL